MNDFYQGSSFRSGLLPLTIPQKKGDINHRKLNRYVIYKQVLLPGIYINFSLNHNMNCGEISAKDKK